MTCCLSEDIHASWHVWWTSNWTLETAHSEPKEFNGPWEMSHCHWNWDKLCLQNQAKLPLGNRGEKLPAHWQAQAPQCKKHAYSHTQILGQGDEVHTKLCSTLGSPTWGHGRDITLLTSHRKAKYVSVAAKTVQRHLWFMRPHHSVTFFLLAPSTSLLTKTTPQLSSEKTPEIHFTPSWHGRKPTATNTERIVVVLSIVFPRLLIFPLLKTRQPAQPHGDDNTTVMHGVIITVFRHGHYLSHHTKWSLHEHQQVLGTGFVCTAWLSHGRGEWISVVPCREAAFLQNKQKAQSKCNQQHFWFFFFPPK